jgi:hypothetical protein
MSTLHLTDEELERLLSKSLSCPPDIAPPTRLVCGVWERIDAWEENEERAKSSQSVLARIMGTRMRNGEPVVVLAGALLFGALFVGLFLAGAYLFAAHSSTVLRVLQYFIGPNLGELKSLVILCALVSVGGMLLGSLALSERLFGLSAGSAA